MFGSHAFVGFINKNNFRKLGYNYFIIKWQKCPKQLVQSLSIYERHISAI